MNVTIDCNALSAAIARGAAARRHNMQVLEHAKLIAEGDTLAIETSDLEVYARTTLQAEVKTAGAVCMKADLLAAACAADGSAIITPGLVKRGRSSLRVAAYPDLAHFPSPDEASFEPLELSAAHLARAIDVVSYAADPEDAHDWCRPLHLAANQAVATDCHRMAVVDIDFPGPRLMIPHAQLPRIRKLLDVDGVKLAVGNVHAAAIGPLGGMLRVEAGDTTLIVRLLSTNPPDFLVVIPQTSKCHRVVLRRAPMLAALRRFLPFGDNAATGINARFDFGPTSEMSSRSGNIESLDECVELGDEPPVTIGLNVRYLSEVLTAIETEQAVMWVPQQNARMVLLEPSDEIDGDPRRLIATVNV